MEINTVGVVGAGVIGAGVAQDLACSGYRVLLIDTNDHALQRGEREIKQAVRFKNLFRHRKPAVQSSGDVLGRITFTNDYGALESADFIIENVPEIWETK